MLGLVSNGHHATITIITCLLIELMIVIWYDMETGVDPVDGVDMWKCKFFRN